MIPCTTLDAVEVDELEKRIKAVIQYPESHRMFECLFSYGLQVIHKKGGKERHVLPRWIFYQSQEGDVHADAEVSTSNIIVAHTLGL